MSSHRRTNAPSPVRFKRSQCARVDRQIADYFIGCDLKVLLVCSANPQDQQAALIERLRLVLDSTPGMSEEAQEQLLAQRVHALVGHVIHFSHRGSVVKMDRGYAADQAAGSDRFEARERASAQRYANRPRLRASVGMNS
jgi:hypothetical protein